LEQRLLHNVGTMPGVQAAVLSGTPVLAGVTFFEPPLRSSAATLPRYQHHAVGPGYFRLLDIPLLRGRDFRPEDWQQKPMVAVVNRAFAQRAWPNSDPIGKTLRPASGKGVFSLRVVGVVGDTRDNRVADAPMPEIYTEFSGAVQSVVVFVRSRGDPDASWSAWSQSLRREVWSTAGDVPITLLHPLRDVVAAAHAGPRFRATVLASLALLGLVLAVLGVYSVFAYAASRRRQEVAIRMALGARPAAITALYLSSGLRVALAGVALGVPGAWLAERVLRAELPGLIPGGTGALVAAAALLFAAAMAACYLPARRAHDARLTDWLRQP
ncbi:MAG: FtsX-like permease family protein, partial [Terriglobales bacterium]